MLILKELFLLKKTVFFINLRIRCFDCNPGLSDHSSHRIFRTFTETHQYKISIFHPAGLAVFIQRWQLKTSRRQPSYVECDSVCLSMEYFHCLTVFTHEDKHFPAADHIAESLRYQSLKAMKRFPHVHRLHIQMIDMFSVSWHIVLMAVSRKREYNPSVVLSTDRAAISARLRLDKPSSNNLGEAVYLPVVL